MFFQSTSLMALSVFMCDANRGYSGLAATLILSLIFDDWHIEILSQCISRGVFECLRRFYYPIKLLLLGMKYLFKHQYL